MSDYQYNEHVDPTASPRWQAAPLRKRTRIKKRIHELAEAGYAEGYTDHETLRHFVGDQLQGDDDCKAILTIVGLAVLSAVIQWLVTRWLDRRHPKGT